ncbi:MAG: NUDIX domain-containing protein [Actinomycetota bacterium]
MAVFSAGVLLYRQRDGLEVLIAHPGGPFWARRQEGAWSIPKGEFDPEEESGIEAARREFAEELGQPAPDGRAIKLGEARLKSGKRIVAWALAGDLDPAAIESNRVEIEWPPRSGRSIDIPEIDEARWVDEAEARRLLNPAQVAFVDRLIEQLA